ncbi:MAG: hypothetical protein OXU20_37765, partial [Myxococcales bacterium]|nr:hypothetical protein [Myxococcales bacterium]
MRNCAYGSDCDDGDPAVTHQCRECSREERGCPCDPAEPPQPCFELPEQGQGGALICREGTRYCRDGIYSGCEDVFTYRADDGPLETAAINDTQTPETCDTCRVNCFVVKDPLTGIDGGVEMADGGGITLPTSDAGVGSPGGDAGTQVVLGGLPSGCTFGGPPDTDCDGIDDDFDALPTSPNLSGNDNATIFFQLGPGDSGLAQLRLGYQVRNADVYFLLDMSTTMSDERDRLVAGLTTGNFYDGLSGVPADCADVNRDGLPDNELKDYGIVGAIRCMIGGAWVGTGYFREVPYSGYGHSDDHLFRHLVDMTPDVDPVRAALQGMRTNGNLDYPEAGALALWSLATGKGQWFGVDRPAVPERVTGPLLSTPTGCPAGARGFPCFRDGPVPIVVMFTDDEFGNGPGGGSPTRSSFTINNDRNTDGLARYTPQSAEAFDTAHNVGDLSGQYLTLMGDTTRMRSDIPRSIMGCGTDTNAPDTVYRFVVPAGGPWDMRFSVTDDEEDNTPATDFDMAMSLFAGVPGVIGSPTDLGDATAQDITSGPDLVYLTFTGVTDGTNSALGARGGISGCGADGATNEVMFTFQPSVDANVVFDASASGFGPVLSLHQGLPSDLPTAPTPTAITNNNDEFSSATPIIAQDSYDSYAGNSGLSMSQIDADYGPLVVGCNANPTAKDSVFTFDLSEPRRVRLDTEGSSFGTTISLHDGPPPDVQITTGVTGNDALPGLAIGNVRGSAYELHSGGGGTAALGADYTGLGCGADDTTGDAAFSFSVDQDTDLLLDVAGVGGFDPVVALFAALPGNIVTLDAGANDNTDEASAFDVGDVHAQEQVRIAGGDTTAGVIAADYDGMVVPCGSVTPAPDAVYRLVAGVDTTIRARVTAASWDASIAVFAGTIAAGTELACDSAESGLDVDVSAGTDYFLVVKGHTGADAGPYTLELRALFAQRLAIDNAAGGNETSGSALSLPDVYRSKVVVDNASTSGMTAEYPVSALGCGTDDQAPDAVYQLSTSLPTSIDIRTSGGAWAQTLTLYDGPPPVATPLTNLNPGNSNEDALTAQPVDLSDVGERFVGDTTSMTHDVDPSLLACSAASGARDATFSFTVSTPTEVNVSVPSSTFGAVLGLFQGTVASPPSPVVVENDTVGAANGNPSPTPNTTANWLRYDADMGNLTTSTQTASAVDNSANANPTAQTALDLGDIYGRHVTIGGADTSSQGNDYQASVMQCGGDDSAPDAVYRFTTGSDSTLRATLSPSTGYNAAIALFDGGTNLASLRYPRLASEAPIVTNLNPGNGNEDVGSAHALSVYPEETVVGNTSGMVSDLDGTLFDVANGASCSAAPSAPDAFFRFTLGSPTTVNLSSAGSNFATTMALYSASGVPAPEAAQTMENDTRSAAASNPVGAVQGRWHVLTGDLSGLTNSNSAPATQDNSSNANETGTSALSLGDVSAAAVTVTNADTSAMTSDHTPSCAASPGAPDAVYSFTPSVDASVQIEASGAYTPILALYDGPPPVGFGYTPSNFDPLDAAIDWSAAPDLTLNCGTSTFNSTSGTFSNWCGNANPQVLVRSQSSGPDVSILVIDSLTVTSGNTLRLTGSRPVILAVHENATIAGTIDASSTS